MRVQVDELNFQIIKLLRDGRRSFGEVAKELGVAENTVRARVKKLTDAGVLSIQGLVDPYTIPNHFMALVGVKLNTPNLMGKAEEFAKLRGVVNTLVITGQYDLIVTVLFNSEFSIKRFYLEEVPKVSEVRSTETWVVYHNVGYTIPYVL